jgi:hypothetical protein
MSTTPTDIYTHKINGSHYTFKVTLYAGSGPDARAQDINPVAIKSLEIEDTFNNFYQQGSIVITNYMDILERDTPELISTTNPSYYDYNASSSKTSNQNAGLIFNGESRDILRIEIIPQLDGTNPSGMGSEDGKKLFKLEYDFVIYNSEEMPGDQPDQKYKKLYFWDLYYQLMLEKNVPFSTASLMSSSGTQQSAIDIESGVKTGIVLKEFIKATFPQSEGYAVEFSTNTTGTADSTTLTQQQQDDANIDWDIGATKMFFSTPANYKAIDCVNYILSRHVSNAASDFDQCFLHLERYPRRFTFKSVKQYFTQAFNKQNNTGGDLYLETIKLGGYTNQDARSAPETYFTPKGELYLERIGTVTSFSFDNMAGMFSQNRLVPHLVHSYDNQNKQFNIDIFRNSVEEAMKTYQKNYVTPLNSGGNEPAFPNFAPGQLRYTNKNINNVFSVVQQDPDQRLAAGKNRFLYASVFGNNLMSFRLPGATHRQAGQFVGIDRDGAVPVSKFDNKLLGIYLIIDVKHVFQGNEYYNELHCIKTYNFKQLSNTSDSEDTKGLISNGF